MNGIEVIYNHVILVLKGVSLAVPEGGIVALLGRQRRGQDHHAEGGVEPAARRARRGHQGRRSSSRGERVDALNPSDLVKRGVIQVMEGRHCFAHLTVEENLLTGAYTRRPRAPRSAHDLERVYEFFPRLKQRRTSLAGYTSGGEQQMTAIGRALMARPTMILLDEPSMGLAPQIVEEIFEIVKNLNAKERVSFLLAEQNTMVALRFADFGYILENGRVVMEGNAAHLAENEDVKEFYLGISSGGRGAASARPSTTGAASAGWRDAPGTSTRSRRASPRSASATCSSALPRQVAHATATRAVITRSRCADVDPAAVTSRAALARAAGHAQVRPRRAAARAAALRRAQRDRAIGALARIFMSPGPIYDPEGRGAGLLAHGAHALRRGVPPRRPGAQLLFLPPDARRQHVRDRAAPPRLRGDPGRRRARPSCRRA